MSNDLNNDLVVLIRGLVSWDYYLGSGQVLQLIHLGVGAREAQRASNEMHMADEDNSGVACFA